MRSQTQRRHGAIAGEHRAVSTYAKSRRNARKATTPSGCMSPRGWIPSPLLEGRKPDGFGRPDPSGDGHRETGPSGARRLVSQPAASAEGTGLEEEPSLRQTTGDPPQGGCPTPTGLRLPRVRGPRLRPRAAGSDFDPRLRPTTRVEQPGEPGNRSRSDRSERKFTSARTPRGQGFGRASSGFFAFGAAANLLESVSARSLPVRGIGLPVRCLLCCVGHPKTDGAHMRWHVRSVVMGTMPPWI